MAERRYCVIVSSKTSGHEDTPAWFHQLGPGEGYDESNNLVALTRAFVERISDGRLLEVEPSRIKFVPEPQIGVV